MLLLLDVHRLLAAILMHSWWHHRRMMAATIVSLSVTKYREIESLHCFGVKYHFDDIFFGQSTRLSSWRVNFYSQLSNSV